MMTSAFGSLFCMTAASCCADCGHQSLIILRANRAAGVSTMTLKQMRVACARPASCEISQIVNSHHENSKEGPSSESNGLLLDICPFVPDQ
jgi:hypothetical protein